MTGSLDSVRAEWRRSRRLRIAAGATLLLLLFHAAAALSDRRQVTMTSYAADHRLLERLRGAAAEDAWAQRADEAQRVLDESESTIVAVAGGGEAQAELQAALSALGATAGLTQLAVRTEGASEIDGLPGLLEVTARLQGTGGYAAFDATARGLAERPWLQVERIEIRDGAPGQIQLIVRGYFRLRGAEAMP